MTPLDAYREIQSVAERLEESGHEAAAEAVRGAMDRIFVALSPEEWAALNAEVA